MATLALGPIEFDGTISGNNPHTWYLPEAASQTWKAGAVLTLDVNGFVTIGATDEDRILGVAIADGQGLTTNGEKDTPFLVANADTIFRGNLYHASGASSTAWDNRFVGREYGVVLVTNFFHVDLGDLTNRACRILGLSRDMSTADLQAKVRFQFRTDKCALAYTS